MELTCDLETNKKQLEKFQNFADEIIEMRKKLEKLNKSAQHLLETCSPLDGSISKEV